MTPVTRSHRETAALFFVGTDNIESPVNEHLRAWIETGTGWGISSKFVSFAQMLADHEAIGAERERVDRNLGLFEVWRALGQPAGQISAPSLADVATTVRAALEAAEQQYARLSRQSSENRARAIEAEKERDELRVAAEENGYRWTELVSEICCADEQRKGHQFLAAGWRRLAKSWRENWRNAMSGLSAMGQEKMALHAEADRMLELHLEETRHLAEQRDLATAKERESVCAKLHQFGHTEAAWLIDVRSSPAPAAEAAGECTCGRGMCIFH